VYANALFEAAQEKDRLDVVREQLREVVDAEAEVPELRELLRNPQLDPRARAAALEDVLGDAEVLLKRRSCSARSSKLQAARLRRRGASIPT
jgi:F0F1-type ATP synthase delta subunit